MTRSYAKAHNNLVSKSSVMGDEETSAAKLEAFMEQMVTRQRPLEEQMSVLSLSIQKTTKGYSKKNSEEQGNNGGRIKNSNSQQGFVPSRLNAGEKFRTIRLTGLTPKVLVDEILDAVGHVNEFYQQDAKEKGKMLGAPIGREKFSVNHLFFADDCILFGDASNEGAEVVRTVIHEYEVASGQRVNFDKSPIYFGANVAPSVRGEIVNLLGVRLASNLEKYLGFPMMVGRRKKWAFANFVDRFKKRIEGWSLRYLSMGGNEVFIKSVLQAISIYAMQCFLLPKTLCRSLESIMNRFWWTNNKTLKGIHWSNWDALCKPKCLGGLGFKNLYLFNKALLVKQVWRILSQPQCLLAKVLKARYFPFSDVLTAKEIRPFWTTINQLIINGDGIWNKELIHSLVDDDTASRIFSIPLSKSGPEDMRVWEFEGSGEYTVRSGYRALITDYLQSNLYMPYRDEVYKGFYTDLWALNIPEKIKIHAWRLFNNLVPHYGNLARRTLCEETVCPLCKEELESTEHLLWSCGVLQNVWTSLQIQIPLSVDFLDSKDNFVKTYFAADSRKKRIITISLWCIWFHRNKLVNERVKFSLPKLLGFIRGYEQELCFVYENLYSKFATTIVLARDYRGEVVGADTYLYEEVVDAFVVEARACEKALLFTRMMGFRRLIVEGGSLTVIKSVKKQEEDRSVLKLIIHYIRRLHLLFEDVTYNFVPREVNGAAHALALEGRRRRVCGNWVDDVLDSVRLVVETDWLSWIQRI
ncbi:uncharacterized protein LOC105762197 [Gossypium raimondii]|uniref:uncharacterized protein LOC105762197 n=1 Tax=Gossypium raimondii TaxID=29730 RepID=UPI00063A8B70|nr:uncharacterized protein LOC105762197 [Gossypium raimondii]